MATGKVLSFNSIKGYGFIASDSGGEDVFIHANDFQGGKILLQSGARVEFTVEQGLCGPKATAARRIQEPPTSAPAAGPVAASAPTSPASEDVEFDVLTVASFKIEVTEALLREVRSLSAGQIQQVRGCILQLVQSHNWVDA